MTQRDFKRFSEFIHSHVGIKLPPAKKIMLESRLHKRLRVLDMSDYGAYASFVFSETGMESELVHLIDAVTTNTTDFFREPKHFDILRTQVLPAWVERHGTRKRLRIWSAGCSIGMEPYTLAMVLSEFEAQTPGFHWDMLATDISSRALEQAVKAIFSEDRVSAVPPAMKKKYLLRSKDRKKALVRVVPELRRQIKFMRLNFMDDFTFKDDFHIIFCRNVIIYFDRSTQEVLFNKFCRYLSKGGHLFIGHSESLAGMPLPLRQVEPTVYLRD
ncbi:CheR family methyltransferase [Desulfovibrio inopinatus]|uniref:CheR family methyltransferase n=1 Tax=Desulfovibrio inopinatus TaxID=102109 RepID=UPI000686E228|nr:CheR family methyltransferase [Desulfovibrio inopinatus]